MHLVIKFSKAWLANRFVFGLYLAYPHTYMGNSINERVEEGDVAALVTYIYDSIVYLRPDLPSRLRSSYGVLYKRYYILNIVLPTVTA